ncbi:hypothetical protein [Flavobacterium sp. HNIBRBA15423]|uniref:hypothetical protein n=1 Tax=Flavobacterium sp. HNIBRBA15423 TaxID=3458683 RepID=UPI004043DCA0
MLGNWLGYYKFKDEKIQELIGFEHTLFTIIITDFDGIHFKGTVKDDTATGGMEETGIIIGKKIKNTITFKKLMPVTYQLTNLKGERKRINKKHPTLYYSGIVNNEHTQISGKWKFNYKVTFLFGIIPIIYRPGNGTWKMSLT